MYTHSHTRILIVLVSYFMSNRNNEYIYVIRYLIGDYTELRNHDFVLKFHFSQIFQTISENIYVLFKSQ